MATKKEAAPTSVKTKALRQTVTFNASPHDVFEMLMDSKKHGAFTGGKAKISRTVGGTFSAFDGGLHGKNLEVKADKKIVQTWRSNEENWPEGHFSRATFAFSRLGKNRTKLAFYQSGIPSACFADIKTGWHDYYWNPMKAMIAVVKTGEKRKHE